MPKLGVNIDHVATLRQARGGNFPDPVYAAFLAEQAGAQSIVAHLREDRRHIQDKDIRLLRRRIKTHFNLEMSITAQIVKIACRIKPDQATLVPERRQELTTEGGLDVASNFSRVKSAIKKLTAAGICVSLFIDPERKQVEAALKAGAGMIEFHTGRYAEAKNAAQKNIYFKQLKAAVNYARKLKLAVCAGHGLDYSNVRRIAGIKGIQELNIGYAIICQALYVGLPKAVKQMRELIQ